ncbi:MAG: hypothetical protein FK733_16945, partial [Asgard group archaeon]|nr:hypothetical protein [Asgard group archaeon]
MKRNVLIFTFILILSLFLNFGSNCNCGENSFTDPDLYPSAYTDCDVNSDGRLDAIDALMVAQYYVGLISHLDGGTGDFNDNGITDIVDALMISQAYVGLITGGPTTFSSTAGGPDKVWYDSIPLKDVGDVFATTLYVDASGDNCAAYGFELEYDSSIVEIQSVVEGSEGYLMAVNISNSIGVSRFTGFDTTGVGPDDQIEMVDITWEVVGSGETIVNTTIDVLVNNNYADLGTPYTPNTPIIVRMLGDVNGDTFVDASDAFAIAQYCVGLAPISFPILADVNQDSFVNAIDSLLIYQYSEGIIPDVSTPLPSSGGSEVDVYMDSIGSKLLGDTFNTVVHVNATDYPYGAYKLDINYDPDILHITDVTVGADGNLTAYNITNTSGIAQVIGIDCYGSSLGEDLELIVVSWEVVGWGSSTVNMTMETFVDITTDQMIPPLEMLVPVTVPEPLSPFIEINSPEDNSHFSNTMSFDITITSSYPIDELWYTVNDGSPMPFLSDTFFTIDSVIWSGLVEGEFDVQVYANDSEGLTGFVEIQLVKDTILPAINLNSPEQSTNFELTDPAPIINLTLADINLYMLNYSINNGIIYSITLIQIGYNLVIINSVVWEELEDGNVTIRFTISDYAGNINYLDVL